MFSSNLNLILYRKAFLLYTQKWVYLQTFSFAIMQVLAIISDGVPFSILIPFQYSFVSSNSYFLCYNSLLKERREFTMKANCFLFFFFFAFIIKTHLNLLCVLRRKMIVTFFRLSWLLYYKHKKKICSLTNPISE